jgi:hypothetical protein
MPAYSFQQRFVPMVLDGSKCQTIRKRRTKGYAKPGDTLYLYYGLRTKWCKKLREETCTRATTIIINSNGHVYLFNKRLTDEVVVEVAKKLKAGKLPLPAAKEYTFVTLSKTEKDELAWKDGFRDEENNLPFSEFEIMLSWWKQTHELPFIGDIIYWQPNPANSTFSIQHSK